MAAIARSDIMEKIAAGTVAGYGVISADKLPVDDVYASQEQAAEHARKLGCYYGRRLIVKLVVVEEVV